jgi:hypothetical protein
MERGWLHEAVTAAGEAASRPAYAKASAGILHSSLQRATQDGGAEVCNSSVSGQPETSLTL